MGLGLGINLTKRVVSAPYTWIPTDVNGLAVWHRNGTDYTSVTQWDDSSGNNNHALQETEGNQAAELSGGLYFDGDNDYYEYSENIDLASEDSFTMAIVYNLDATVVKNTIWSKDANNAFIEFKDAGTVKCNYSSSVVELSGGTHTAGSVRSMIITRLGATGAHKMYEGSDTVVATGTQTGAATFSNLGVRNDNDRWFDGKIYEVMIWDNVNFKGDNLSNLIQYINNVQNSIIL